MQLSKQSLVPFKFSGETFVLSGVVDLVFRELVEDALEDVVGVLMVYVAGVT